MRKNAKNVACLMLSRHCETIIPVVPPVKKYTHMKIKSTLFGGLAAAALLAISGAQASASTIVLNTNNFSDSAGGGEFAATVTSPSSLGINTAGYSTNAATQTIFNGNFETFCLEANVEFNPGVTYNVSVSQTVLKTGGPLTIGAAWLYTQFAAGTLSGYNYSQTSKTGGQYDRAISALGLQYAIWYLQAQSEPGNGPLITLTDANNHGAGAFLTDLANSAYSATKFNANNGTLGVAALVLTTVGNPNDYHQDQLVLTSPGGGGGAGVPDGGATVALLGAAIGGMSFFKRRLAAA